MSEKSCMYCDDKERFISILRATNRTGIANVIAGLEKLGFFMAPALTRFHGSGNFHAGQKACANCVEAGGRLAHESMFAGPA